MRNALLVALAVAVCSLTGPIWAAAPTGQTVTLNLDYFDVVVGLGLWDLDRVEEEMAQMMADSAQGGVDRILYRISVCGEVSYRSQQVTTFNGDPRKSDTPGNLQDGFECDRLKVVLDEVETFSGGGGGCALDYRQRSIVLDFGAPQRVTRLRLAGNQVKAWPTPVTQDTLSVWISEDNQTYTLYEGDWQYDANRNEAGDVVIELSNLDMTTRYTKVHCSIDGDAFTFANCRLGSLLRAYGGD